jgi:NDP-4-keto-2,6-dideoxyhexose 3-C-methyltransferase
MYTQITECRVCKNTKLSEIISLGNQHLTGVFPREKSDVITHGPVTLVKCTGDACCGLVQLLQSYDMHEMYGMNYGYRSGLNSSMVDHLRSKVQAILSWDLLENGDLVIDIGSNDSTTLRCYPDDAFDLVGVDPTGVKFSEFYPSYIKLIPELFSADIVRRALGEEKRAKIITSFSMFYDLEDPVKFAREIESMLDPEGVWLFEQSYLPAMLQANSFDTICHEHLEFYSLKQIIWILSAAGMQVLDVEFNDINGGSFSIKASKIASSHKPDTAKIDIILAEENEMGISTMAPFIEFNNRIEKAKEDFVSFLVQAKQSGKRVCALGASTKGNVLLQYFGITEDLIESIGEVNPDKIGSFTPGSLIPIISQEEVLASKPDYVVILPWHFRSFFLSSALFKNMRLVFPLPSLEILPN